MNFAPHFELLFKLYRSFLTFITSTELQLTAREFSQVPQFKPDEIIWKKLFSLLQA